jgi:CheY-like chemotaxis protein
VLKELKKISAFTHIPVIMYSTSFAPRDIVEINQLGAVYHLLKPSRFDELCHSLSHVLRVEWMNGKG